MGGIRSGERSDSRSRTSSYHEFDVRRWQRSGVLLAGKSFADRYWKIDVSPYPDVSDTPYYAIVSSQPGVEFVLRLDWTRCNYGGMRAWFRCPSRNCGRRVAILYSTGVGFACRHCLGLAYDSQQECTRRRRFSRARAIRMKLGGSPSLADPFPAKPKGMHWSTYYRLLRKGLSCEEQIFAALRIRLGL